MTVLPTLLLLLACTTTDKTDEEPLVPVRRVLHEVFTGSTCGPCLEADGHVEDVIEANADRTMAIKYQLGGDPYVSKTATTRRMGYLPGESSYAIPFVHADGVHGFHPNEMGEERAYEQTDFDGFLAEAAILDIQVEYSIEGQTVTIGIQLEVTEPLGGDALTLHAVITENETTNNVGTNGQTAFHDVMQGMVPDVNGTLLEPLVPDDPQRIALEYTFQGEHTDEAGFQNPVDHAVEHTVEEFDDLEVVVFVQDSETWEVFNAMSTSIGVD